MENPFFDFLRRSGGGSGSSRTPWEGLGFYDALGTIGGRQGVGTHIKLQNYIFDLLKRQAEGAYRELPQQIGGTGEGGDYGLFTQPRQDILSSFGGQFQDTADRQAALQSRLDQQFGRSGLGSLRGTQTAALEQQAQRQNLGTRDAMSRQLGGIGLARASAMAQAYGGLPNFLASMVGPGTAQAGQGALHAVARKSQSAQQNNAFLQGLGGLGGAALGSPWLGAALGFV